MSVTFTSGSSSVTITRNIEHSSDFWFDRINQKTQETTAGGRLTFDNSRSILRGVLNIRLVTKSEADSLRNFLINSIRFQRFEVTITPESFNDLGLGDGVAITGNFNGGPTSKDIITPLGKASKFNIKFPYRVSITPAAGTADQEGNIA